MKKIFTLTLFALPFIAMAQLQNTSFEQWQTDPAAIEEWMQNKPTGWTLRNDFFESEEATFYYPADIAAQDGDYALKLGIWYNYVKDEAKQKAPIDYRPSTLTGFYKYTENDLLAQNNEIVKDTARVSVFLTKWNAALSQNDTIGSGKIHLNESLDYSSFTCNINYTSLDTPDSIIVLLDCSKLKRDGDTGGLICPNNNGSYFTVDNLKLEALTMGSDDFIAHNNVKLYPNPAVNSVAVTNFSGEAAIYDMTGKLVLSKRITEGSVIDLQQLSKGVYAVKLAQGNSVTYSRLIKD